MRNVVPLWKIYCHASFKLLRSESNCWGKQAFDVTLIVTWVKISKIHLVDWYLRASW